MGDSRDALSKQAAQYVVALKDRAVIHKSSPVEHKCQVTFKQAKGSRNARRILKLCYIDLANGLSKQEVEDRKKRLLGLKGAAAQQDAELGQGVTRKRPAAMPRNGRKRVKLQDPPEDEVQTKEELHEEIAGVSVPSTVPVQPPPPVPVHFSRPAFARPCPVSTAVENFEEEDVEIEDEPVDTVYKVRRGMPFDSPLRPELRDQYVFVAQARDPEKKIRFTRNFQNAIPLSRWTKETNCDLCNRPCPRELFMLRCFARKGPFPRELDKAVLYAGRDCTQVLLRTRRASPAKELRQKLEKLIREENDLEARLQQEVGACKSKLQVDGLLQEMRYILGMDRPVRPARIQTRQGTRSEYSRPLRHLKKPLADQSLNERLKPEGLRVQWSSSVWTAIARAIQPSNTRLLASRAQRICSADMDNAAASEEECLKHFLNLTHLKAEIYDVDINPDAPFPRPLHPAREPIVGTLRLCCLYGHFAGAGVCLSKEEVEAMKAQTEEAKELFKPEEQEEHDELDHTQIASCEDPHAPIEVHDSSSEIDVDAEQGQPPTGSLGTPAAVPDGCAYNAVELQERAEIAVKLLRTASETLAAASAERKSSEPVLAPSPSAVTVEARQPHEEPAQRQEEEPAQPEEAVVNIPALCRGQILGCSGRSIRELQRSYGVYIKIPKMLVDKDDHESTLPVKITSSTAAADMDGAVAAIQRLYHRELVQIPFHDMGRVIGTKGWKFKELANKHSSVKMKLNNAERIMSIIGEFQAVTEAAQEVRSKCSETERKRIPPASIGAFQSHCRYWRSKYRAKIQVVDELNGIVEVIGKPTEVNALTLEIEDFTQQFNLSAASMASAVSLDNSAPEAVGTFSSSSFEHGASSWTPSTSERIDMPLDAIISMDYSVANHQADASLHNVSMADHPLVTGQSPVDATAGSSQSAQGKDPEKLSPEEFVAMIWNDI
mmetsp:Transcript_13781/g.25547  ORF Transcript_13781/g.25547 Transcript_13781/m.25547 type:complete len:946 (-) Transcript_13781:81-2918(-)